MQMQSWVTVQFDLEEEEKEILNNAMEIMRKIKTGFLTRNMSEHQELMKKSMHLISDIVQGKEISE
ncbi:hypothetical protein SAMN05216391_10877 [Lachnospiraceae bacterium KHCPX20]|nr:hypothetical protein SAMN05216391_10877 [Lachnospiraceae bacterium KHCPX20]